MAFTSTVKCLECELTSSSAHSMILIQIIISSKQCVSAGPLGISCIRQNETFFLQKLGLVNDDEKVQFVKCTALEKFIRLMQ